MFLLILTLMMVNIPHDIFHHPKIQTPLSPIQLAETLKKTHYSVFGTYPNKSRLAMAWAQIALENGRGNNVYNHNLGNIGSGKKEPHYKIVGVKFKSFSSFGEGGSAYWQLLQNRCPYALRSFNWGDTNATAKYLRSCGYYRANVQIYQNGMRNLYYFFLREIIPELEKIK